MVVIAHPDDAEFTCGGTLGLWAGQGAEINYVVCSDGSKGHGDPSLSSEQLADMRKTEQRAAADVLGVRGMAFLDYPDGELDREVRLERELVLWLRRFRPDLVLTFDPWRPYQIHPDHRVVGFASINAILAAGNARRFSDQLTDAHRVETVYLFSTDRPDVWVDITATFERKLAAIDRHRSQVGEHAGIPEQMRACNLDHGQHTGFVYAEAFRMLKPFCEA
jgi:LmbE family N-acetylglucosaminyl deacetylase